MSGTTQLPTPSGPYLDKGPLPADFYAFEDLLTDGEREKIESVREFLRTQAAPIVDDYWARAEFPFQLVEGFGSLGLVDWADPDSTEPRPSNLFSGFLALEFAHADASLATFSGVHTGLAMGTVLACGSDEQKRRWLPSMSRFEKIGAFALTEPHGGSDVAGGLRTTARRDGDEWILDGAKRWIGNATFADMVVVWARDVDTQHVLGFVVEKDTPGFTATKIENKMALRIVQNADIVLEGCRVPEANRLQNANTFKDTMRHSAPDAQRCGVAGGGGDVRRLRDRPAVREGARAVRAPDRRLPAGAGSAGEDARQRHGLVRDGDAPGPVAGRRDLQGRTVGPGEGLLHRADARERRVGPGTAHAATASSSTTRSAASWPTPRPSIRTRARGRSRP